jgi:hypothetical protein
MNLFNIIKERADINGDGKLTPQDLDSLKDGNNNEALDKLKDLADRNSDGKLSLDDVKDIDFNNAVGDLNNKLGSLFGSK